MDSLDRADDAILEYLPYCIDRHDEMYMLGKEFGRKFIAVCPFGKNPAYLLEALRGAQHTSHSSPSFEQTGKSLFHSR